MTTVADIEKFLFAWAPKDTAEEWDNVGLLVGNPSAEVRRVTVALDVTEAVIDEAISNGSELIVAHHPLMNCKWQEVQSVRSDGFIGKKLIKSVENHISVICMHTNLDAAEGGVNDCLAAAVGLSDVRHAEGDNIVRIGTILQEKTLAEYLPLVLKSLGVSGLRYRDGGRSVHRVAVGGGACGYFIEAAKEQGCDTFITSDLKYNQFLDTEALNLIDAGHFPTEDVVCAEVVRRLASAFPALTIRKSAVHTDAVEYYTKEN